MALVEIAIFQDGIAAEIVRGRLEAEGIEAVLVRRRPLQPRPGRDDAGAADGR